MIKRNFDYFPKVIDEDETYQLDFLYHRIKHPMNKTNNC